MPPDSQRPVVEAALRAAEPHGFALGGNAALTAHGLPGFATKIMELVTPGRAVRDAARAVEKELRSQGYAPERFDTSAERRHAEPVSPGSLALWRVPIGKPHEHPPIGGITTYKCQKCFENVLLEMRRAPRSQEPVRTAVGPVLHVEDAAASKIRDLNRGRARDYADVARLMERWSPRQLAGFAQRLDPKANPARDLDRAAERLAATPDIALYGYGNSIPPEQVPQVREKFANWRSDPRDTARWLSAPQAERPAPGREARYRPTEKGLAWIRKLHEAERGEPQRQQPAPAARPRAEPARQALPPQREQREARHSEPERGR
jgi:hypothetical protein